MQKKYLNQPNLADNIRLGVGIILHTQNKLILENRVDCNNWGLIGGGVEIDEQIENAAIRECYEETSIRLKKEKLKILGFYSDIRQFRIIKYPDNCFHAIDVIFHYKIFDNVSICKSNESNDIRFFSIDSLPKNIVPPARDPINDFIKLDLLCNN